MCIHWREYCLLEEIETGYYGQSHVEVEYKSMVLATCEHVWIGQLLQELKFCEVE